jgi:cell division protein FtsB
MNFLSIVFTILIVSLQYPLWFGRGGWINVYEMQKEIDTQQNINKIMQSENETLRLTVNDLKNGTDVIEAKARFDHGLIKKNEIYFQVIN